MESTRDLQKIVTQAAGKPIELDPAESFVLSTPSLKITGDIDLRFNGATLTHDRRWERKSAPMISGPSVSGQILDPVIVGEKPPDAPYRPKYEGHAALWFMGAEDLYVRAHILHVAGDGCYLGAIKGGSAKTGGPWWKPCRNVTLELHAEDMGRHALAAVGVESCTIKAESVFRGWRRLKIDRENTNGYRTKPSAITDLGASWEKRTT